jgi:hypothetical protein
VAEKRQLTLRRRAVKSHIKGKDEDSVMREYVLKVEKGKVTG